MRYYYYPILPVTLTQRHRKSSTNWPSNSARQIHLLHIRTYVYIYIKSIFHPAGFSIYIVPRVSSFWITRNTFIIDYIDIYIMLTIGALIKYIYIYTHTYMFAYPWFDNDAVTVNFTGLRGRCPNPVVFNYIYYSAIAVGLAFRLEWQ